MSIELIIEELKEDKEKLKKFAEKNEEKIKQINDLFKLYEALEDKEKMVTVGTNHFVESAIYEDIYLKKLDIEPTKEMYEERGNHFLKEAIDNTKSKYYPGIDFYNYGIAFKAFKKSNNQEKLDLILNNIDNYETKTDIKPSNKTFKPILNVLKYIGLGTLLGGLMYLSASSENIYNKNNDQQNIKIEEVSKQYIK